MRIKNRASMSFFFDY